MTGERVPTVERAATRLQDRLDGHPAPPVRSIAVERGVWRGPTSLDGPDVTQGRSATAGGERRGSGARQRGARRRGAWIDFRWRMDGDDLWLVPVDEAAGTLIEQRRSRANFEWPWRRTS